jgi:hypothetical protein
VPVTYNLQTFEMRGKKITVKKKWVMACLNHFNVGMSDFTTMKSILTPLFFHLSSLSKLYLFKNALPNS